MPPSPWVSTDLLKRLCTLPEMWDLPLWHWMCPTTPIDELLQVIQHQKALIISSNASVNAAKHSCCAWSLYGGTTLWQGEGIVPGNCNDTYSSRSEAFGILTALLFLQHYLTQFPLIQLMLQSSLTIYCDNGSTITEAMAHLKLSEIFPNHTISDDYDVYHKIGQVMGQLTQFMVAFIHGVKGHQNRRTTKQPLSLPAQLNIECNVRATRFISYVCHAQQWDNPA